MSAWSTPPDIITFFVTAVSLTGTPVLVPLSSGGTSIVLPNDGLNHIYILTYGYSENVSSGTANFHVVGTALSPIGDSWNMWAPSTGWTSPVFGSKGWFLIAVQGNGATLGMQIDGTFTGTVNVWGLLFELT